MPENPECIDDSLKTCGSPNGYSAVSALIPKISLIVWCLLLGECSFAQVLPYKLFGKQDGLPAQQVSCIFKDSRNYLWVGTIAGLARFNGERFERMEQPGDEPQKITRIHEDAEGIIWFLTPKGIGRYNGAERTFFPFADGAKRTSTLQILLKALETQSNDWVANCSGGPSGITLFNKKSQKTEALPLEISLTCADSPQNALEEANCYWVAAKEGFVQVFHRGFRQLRYPELTQVWGGIEDDRGNILFSNYDGQLIQYAGICCQPISATTDRYFYFHPAKDGQGALYFPEARGVLKWSRQGARTIAPTVAGTGPLTRLYATYDSIDQVILASGQGGTLWLIDRFDRVQVISNEKGLHRKRSLQCAIRDQRNNYWMGSMMGLSRYAIPEKRLYYYLPEEERLPLTGVLCMKLDSSGRLWMGGQEGLGYWDYAGDSLVLIMPEVFSQGIKQIAVADKWLVVGAQRGLYVLDLEVYDRTGKWVFAQYNRQNGFTGIEPVQSGAFLDRNGRLWVLSANQVGFIPISDIGVKAALSRVRITEINGKKLAWSASEQVVPLKRNTTSLSMRFEAIGYNRAAPVRYAWKLEGSDPGFSEWSSKDSVSFQGLSPGVHRLVVKAYDPSKVALEDMPKTSVLVRVRMDVWRREDFDLIALIGLLALGIVTGAFLYAARKAERQAEEKERLLNYYQVHALQAQLKPHFIFNLLATMANRIRKDNKEEAIQHILQMETLLRNFLESSISGNILNTYGERNKVALSREIELLSMYVQLVQAQAPGVFECSLEVDPALDAAKQFIPPMIIQPFVENAIKHGLFLKPQKPGHLWLRFVEAAGGVKCEVEDDGVGREYAMQMGRKEPGRPASRGTALVRERIALLTKMGAQIGFEVRDRPGGGTIVEIVFS